MQASIERSPYPEQRPSLMAVRVTSESAPCAVIDWLSESRDRTVAYKEFEPPRALKAVAQAFWHYSFSKIGERSTYRILPDADVALLIHARTTASSNRMATPRLTIFGPTGTVSMVEAVPGHEVIGVRLSIGIARVLFGLEPQVVLGQEIEARECCPSLALIADELNAVSSPSEALIFLAQLLSLRLSLLQRGSTHRRRLLRVTEAARILQMDDMSIRQVATMLGVSERTLHRDMTSETGLAPKVFARIVRFRRAWHLLQTGGSAHMAEVALRCGFSDQSHMIADFQDLAGAPPTALLATAHQA